MASERTSRVAKNTMMNYLRMGAGMIIMLYTSRVVLNTLGVDDYGVNAAVGGVVGMMAILINFMQTGTQRFLNFAMGKGDKQGLNDIFCVSITIHVCIAVLIILFSETIGLWFLLNKMVIPAGRETAAFWVFQFSILSTVTSVMSIPYNAEVIAHERMSIYAYFTILGLALKLLIVYLLVVSHFDKLITYSFLLFCTSLFSRLLFTWYCRRNFEECHYHFRFPPKLIRDMLSFPAWDLFGVVAWTCSTQGTTILLNLFFGPAVNAASGIASRVESSVRSFSSNFLSALSPQITKSYAAQDYNYLYKIMYGGAKLSFILLFAITLPLYIKIDYVLVFWLKLVPDHTATIVRIILIEMILDSMMTPLNTAALATGRIRYYGFATSVMTIIQLPLCYIILKMGGSPESVFVTMLTVTIIREIVQYYKLRNLVGFRYLDYFRKVQLPCILVVAASVPLPLIISQALPENFWTLLLIIIVATPLSIILSFFIILNIDERKILVDKIPFINRMK